jgi:hypothetical protein
MSDNTSAVAAIQRQGTVRSRSLLSVAQALLTWSQEHSIQLIVSYIPGKLNVTADRLSRTGVIQTEWCLDRQITQKIFQIYFQPNLDLFAVFHNKVLTNFVSPHPHPQAWGVDAMSLNWRLLSGYAFPPTGLLAPVLAKCQSCQGEIILIAPLWPSKQWYPLLLDLLIDLPICLGQHDTLLFQDIMEKKKGGVRHYHPKPQLYRLHAWRLSGNTSKRKIFLEQLQKEWWHASGSLQDNSMIVVGKSSTIGVLRGIQIPVRQL